MKKGVDISEMNPSVDFQALKKAGIQFVLIRCGFGNDDPDQDDASFFENVRKADAAGMPWGTYLYSYALNGDMARSEARHVLRLLGGRKPSYGVWYDVEDASQAGADLVALCEIFCETIEAAGLYCGIYSMLAWLETKLDSPRLDKYDKWVAQWASACEYRKPYGIWQYTDSLYINGKNFDGNIAYKDYPALTGQKKEEPELTKAEVEKIAAACARSAVEGLRRDLERENPLYKTLEDVPEYWRSDVEALMKEGIIQGTGGGVLGMREAEVKAAVMVHRLAERAER